MANIGRFWSSLHFELHFPRMIQHTKILHMQQQKRDAVEYIFKVHLTTDLCCIKIWHIKDGRYRQISVIFRILSFIFLNDTTCQNFAYTTTK